ncbi:glutamine synthetase III [Erysipelothrix rhusiopathiae]|uniref:glutamine synthetase III n=1 Tax=Erysipelothrix rhusiopathiae TaxID=1648 RepID=UPI000210B634|nr:glutamine synthetase III [Erysipelothrix rhusiopathiae]AMS11175.1 glutamine synthetase [Erysipelothrix rhusiopathiae]AOO67673.1 glutamine synthetase [Erysipelothrix rhusiopathiae]AWU41466.1 glutamine synthetase type III [Erysipelothrix rhusiopathiae]MDE8283924.1 glutamine synthetase III [Erysipelothrix rhusiopathiae]MDV7678332.1 glutamine synthetase III [Erysipelothrix rhusiopathiae]
MKKPYEDFGSKLFTKDVMSEYLPRPVYERWLNAIQYKEKMDMANAEAIAHAMKVWALEHGATHYSHWFHPMTGSSAEKHDAFIEPDRNGKPITRFSGKTLIKGETDGSSFPNGGLRQTFEARGYTYWDVTSPAFIRGHVLFIPSIFISYHGESLDEKAPLLKSMEALSKQATRIVNLLGDKSVTSVDAMIGLEQEYFLVSSKHFEQREDLVFTGRTLLGENAPKGQDLVGHYYGNIPSNVVHYMEDVNDELWKLGVYSKVEHNEVAPAQFEIVTHFDKANIALDQNMIVMETLQRVAKKHHLSALLHEKPFKNINGSGKHNNWSLVTNTGHNLFEPGERPHENIRFLVFVCALVEAVDNHAELLRFAGSSAGNDHRLGSSEAPPAIISLYVGSVLEEIFKQLATSKKINIEKEVQYFTPLTTLSAVTKDYSDRNRTSPFAFTGNKFEFRMPGSSICSAFVNTVLCSIMAESLERIADDLEQYKYVQDIREQALGHCQRIIKAHHRIIFDGDAYHDNWREEALRRGLPNLEHYVDSIPSMLYPDTIKLFKTTEVLSERELQARTIIVQTRFIKTINTEANTLLKMVKQDIMPAIVTSINHLSHSNSQSSYVQRQINDLETNLDALDAAIMTLEHKLGCVHEITDLEEKARAMHQQIRPEFETIRSLVDQMERVISKAHYPFPTYTQLLFEL